MRLLRKHPEAQFSKKLKLEAMSWRRTVLSFLDYLLKLGHWKRVFILLLYLVFDWKHETLDVLLAGVAQLGVRGLKDHAQAGEAQLGVDLTIYIWARP